MPLVAARCAMLEDVGFTAFHSTWAAHVATAEYVNLWDRYRLPSAPLAAVNSADSHDNETNRLERLLKAHREVPVEAASPGDKYQAKEAARREKTTVATGPTDEVHREATKVPSKRGGT